MTTKIPPTKEVQAHHARAAAQTDRERSLAADMRADLSREADRQAAELKIRDGVSVNLADLAVPPTEEWERQGEAVNYTVKTEGQNVQVVTTRRRVRVGQCIKGHRNGHLTDDQFLACEWYQDQYERSGLEGKVRSVDLAAEVRSASTSGYVFNDGQLTAQTRLRAAARLSALGGKNFSTRLFWTMFRFAVPQEWLQAVGFRGVASLPARARSLPKCRILTPTGNPHVDSVVILCQQIATRRIAPRQRATFLPPNHRLTDGPSRLQHRGPPSPSGDGQTPHRQTEAR